MVLGKRKGISLDGIAIIILLTFLPHTLKFQNPRFCGVSQGEPVPCWDTNTEMNLGDASDKTMLEVWFKLNDNDVDAVDLPKGTNMRKFRDEVKDKCTVSLQHCDAAMLHVFAPGADPKTETALDPGDPVPGDTSSKNPWFESKFFPNTFWHPRTRAQSRTLF
jgi:hypothetical protein